MKNKIVVVEGLGKSFICYKGDNKINFCLNDEVYLEDVYSYIRGCGLIFESTLCIVKLKSVVCNSQYKISFKWGNKFK